MSDRRTDGPPSPEEAPGGLLGLLLQPLRLFLAAGLGLFAALVQGILRALLPSASPPPPDDQDNDAPQ